MRADRIRGVAWAQDRNATTLAGELGGVVSSSAARKAADRAGKESARRKRWKTLMSGIDEVLREGAKLGAMAAMEETMAYSADNAREEHLQRFQQPDGHCLQCGRPVNQPHPVGPITVTISDPDNEAFVHEF